MIDLDNVSDEYTHGLRDMAALAFAVADANRSYKDGGIPPADFFENVMSDIDMWREKKLMARLGANEEKIAHTEDLLARATPEPDKLKIRVELPRTPPDEEHKILKKELNDFELRLEEILGTPAEP
jgi:hypothetical protein